MDAAEIEPNPRFEPWIGDTYRQKLDSLNGGTAFPGNCDRLHCLGESHYSDPADPDGYKPGPQLTKQVVTDWGSESGGRSRFFRSLLQIAQGRRGEIDDKASVWSNIAYSNFVQALLPSARDRGPTADEWQDARRRFFAQLAITQPTVLAVLGKRMWQQLPDEGAQRLDELPRTSVGPAVEDAWLYAFQAGTKAKAVVAVCVAHPASPRFDLDLAIGRVNTARYWSSNLLSNWSADRQG